MENWRIQSCHEIPTDINVYHASVTVDLLIIGSYTHVPHLVALDESLIHWPLSFLGLTRLSNRPLQWRLVEVESSVLLSDRKR